MIFVDAERMTLADNKWFMKRSTHRDCISKFFETFLVTCRGIRALTLTKVLRACHNLTDSREKKPPWALQSLYKYSRRLRKAFAHLALFMAFVKYLKVSFTTHSKFAVNPQLIRQGFMAWSWHHDGSCFLVQPQCVRGGFTARSLRAFC